MVIQRWQSVWLLVAAILVVAFCCLPMALVSSTVPDPNSATFLSPSDLPAFLVLNIIIAVLLVLSIFLYKNTKRQKTLTMISMLLLVVAMVTEGLIYFNWQSSEGRIEILGSVFLLLLSLVSAFLALRGIRHDEHLLRAADRLR